MGRFSEMQIYEEAREDTDYPSQEMRLRWRTEDLENRVDKLQHTVYDYDDGSWYSREDLMSAPADCFSSLSGALLALNTARERLCAEEDGKRGRSGYAVL